MIDILKIKLIIILIEIILVKYLFFNSIDSMKKQELGRTDLSTNPILYPVNSYRFKTDLTPLSLNGNY